MAFRCQWWTPMLVFSLATFVKILLIPAYRSTDFEVHRNWLAVTHSLPLSQWYYEATSEWTLDYPPFFAWFEWLLSWPAALTDSEITRVDNLNYDAPSCVLFQRFSVIFGDLTLLYAVIQYCDFLEKRSPDSSLVCRRTLLLSLLLLFNYGLIVVDLKKLFLEEALAPMPHGYNIHFQYNGFLFGILLLSVTRILQGRCLEGALLFAVLLNLKHIFLYIAPAYFVYLLKHYCFRENGTDSNKGGRGPVSLKDFSFVNFLKLGMVVAVIFTVSFAPFVYLGQLGQVVSRLFPFKRGLCHAYWAPNFWALYNLADKVLAAVGLRLGMMTPLLSGSMTSGLVGEMQHQVLPPVAPWVTMVITLAAMVPALMKIWMRPSKPVDFLKCLVLCAYASFLFGWHVHEKAVMMITLPMCLLAVENERYARSFLLLSTTGHLSLFPLLFRSAETLVKVTLFTCYTTMSFILPSTFSKDQTGKTLDKGNLQESSSLPFPGLGWMENCFIVLLLLIQLYCVFIHGTGGLFVHFEFLPLLLTSVSCAVGVVWSWMQCYCELFAGTSVLTSNH